MPSIFFYIVYLLRVASSYKPIYHYSTIQVELTNAHVHAHMNRLPYINACENLSMYVDTEQYSAMCDYNTSIYVQERQLHYKQSKSRAYQALPGLVVSVILTFFVRGFE